MGTAINKPLPIPRLKLDSVTRLTKYHYRPQRSWGKVIFSQASVILSGGDMRGCWGCAWLPGGHVWLLGGVRGCWEACMVARGVHGCQGHAWLWGTCMVAGRHAWLPGGIHDCRGACMVVGGMHGAGGHAWLLEGMHGCWGGHVWLPGGHGCWGGMHGCQGVCVVGGEGVCVVAGGHAWWGGVHGCQGACMGYDEIQSMTGRYASHWNAFLLFSTFRPC